MDSFKWEEKYRIGADDIDDQHKELFRLINNLRTVVKESREAETVKQHMGKMMSFAKVHFAHEEKRMTEAEYPALKEHKVMHQQLIEKAADLNADLELNGLRKTPEILAFMEVWLTGHILGIDMKYSPYLKNNE